MKGNGVDSPITRAVALVRQMPIRWSEEDSDRTVEAVLDGGWFHGPAECARVLMTVAPMELIDGEGFGGRWPLLIYSNQILAPSLPVAVGAEGVVAIDGGYRRDRQGVWREAVGVEELFLATDESQPAPGEGFELLWFGDSERFRLRNGVLEIEDLFGMLSVPATTGLLDRILIRARRIDPAVVSSLRGGDHTQRQTVEVRRQAILSADERWRDPATFLDARADIENAQVGVNCVDIRTVGGAAATFALEEFENGWTLMLRDGSYVLTEIRLERRAMTLSARATLVEALDGTAPGMRGRLIFDLRSDLVAIS